jgi:hypothetical protein
MPVGSDTALRAGPRLPRAVPARTNAPVRPHRTQRRGAARLAWSSDARGRRRTLTDLSYSDRTLRLLTAAPFAVLAGNVGIQLALTPLFNVGSRSEVLTLALMACYLPMVGYQVLSAAHLRRPRGGWWMLAATAVIIAAGLFLIGNEWQLTIAHLLVSTSIVLPRRWAVVAGCLVLAAVVPADLLANPEPNPLWTMLVVVQRAGSVLVPTWFAGALRELRATREVLADQAVLRERVRIDGELTRTVGDSLDTIAGQGATAAALTGADPEGARRELRALVDGSRRTLAEARRLVRAYQRVPLRTELDTAMALLRAAGVPARLALPGDGLPRYAGPELREALRAAVDRLLRDESARTHVITLDGSAGHLRLTVSADGAAR